MPVAEKITIDALRKQTGMSKAELARRANVSIKSLWNVTHGIPVREETITRLLNALNDALRTSYRISDIDFLQED